MKNLNENEKIELYKACVEYKSASKNIAIETKRKNSAAGTIKCILGDDFDDFIFIDTFKITYKKVLTVFTDETLMSDEVKKKYENIRETHPLKIS